MNAYMVNFLDKFKFSLSILHFQDSGKDPIAFTSRFCGA